MSDVYLKLLAFHNLKITVKYASQVITIIHHQLKSKWQCHISSTTVP